METVCTGRGITFGPRHYIPILKVKRGEKSALSSISPHLKQFVVPLLEIVERAGGRSVDDHLSISFKDLASNLQGYARRAFRLLMKGRRGWLLGKMGKGVQT